jgi:hypothetical protein
MLLILLVLMNFNVLVVTTTKVEAVVLILYSHRLFGDRKPYPKRGLVPIVIGTARPDNLLMTRMILILLNF